MKTDSGRFYCGSVYDRLASPVSKGIVRMSLQTLGSLTPQGSCHLYLPIFHVLKTCSISSQSLKINSGRHGRREDRQQKKRINSDIVT